MSLPAFNIGAFLPVTLCPKSKITRWWALWDASGHEKVFKKYSYLDSSDIGISRPYQ